MPEDMIQKLVSIHLLKLLQMLSPAGLLLIIMTSFYVKYMSDIMDSILMFNTNALKSLLLSKISSMIKFQISDKSGFSVPVN